MARAQATAVSVSSQGRHTSMLGHDAQGRDMLHRLVGGAVFAQADGVMRIYIDAARPHERRHAQGVAGVIGEGQEGTAVGDEATVQAPDRS